MPINVISLKEYQDEFKNRRDVRYKEHIKEDPKNKEIFENGMKTEVFYTIDNIHENMFDITNSNLESLLPIHATHSHNFEYELDPYGDNPSPYITDRDLLHSWENPVTWLYGVADNFTQISDYLKTKFIELENDNTVDPNTSVVITATPIIKEHEPSNGGWRWHKWGEYIGIRNPIHEYIYDEDDNINTVWCFNVFVVKEKV